MSEPAVHDANWNRFNYALNRGHRQYTTQARLCERMYLGGGRQWDRDDLQILREQRRPAYEFNEILPSINAALGHQINNRAEITFQPRGGQADQALADTLAKVVKSVADREHLHWKESEVYADGLIQQRGYFDVRVEFDSNLQGNIRVRVLDPLDVIPDPDAKTYEPDGWADVLVTQWLTLDEIEADYGMPARRKCENVLEDEADFGENDDSGEARNKFGGPETSGAFDSIYSDGKVQRRRIVQRQQWVRAMSRCLYYPRSGDIKLVEHLSPEVIAAEVAQGAIETRRMQRRVRWSASTMDVTLHDDWSPYSSFTIVPYFAYFRRGQTVGMVDNAIGPQMALNKALSQYVHIVNSSANSGWKVEQNSLTNMDTEELETKGAMTGLVLEYRKGAAAPEKIEPNPAPQGTQHLIELTRNALKSVTVPDAMRGIDGPQTSGVARQAQQFAAQQQTAMPLDNLSRTRHMLAERLRDLCQQFITDERAIRITETDPATGKPVDASVVVNQFDPATGEYHNDLTAGEYDVVVTSQPLQVTFESGQFEQAKELREAGVAIPDPFMVQLSSLSRKAEIVEAMQAQQGQADPLTQAKAELTLVQAEKLRADTVNSRVESLFSATQAGNQIAAIPTIAPLADKLLKSAGFEDQDAAPIVPSVPVGAVPGEMPPSNTSPNFPARIDSPAEGMGAGIETMDAQVGEPA